MRGGILTIGIILLIFGIFLYFSGNNMVQQVEAYDVEGIPISEILKLVSSDARRQYEVGQQMKMFGSIFGIVGFIVCIAGIATPSKKSEEKNHLKKKSDDEDLMKILKSRYVKGEITKEEFEQMRQDLE